MRRTASSGVTGSPKVAARRSRMAGVAAASSGGVRFRIVFFAVGVSKILNMIFSVGV
jgi:hypothetical protein